MLDTLILSLKLVSPMCAFMAIGYLLQKRNFFSPKTLTELNKFMFNVVIPFGIAKSIYTSDMRSGCDVGLLVFVAVYTTLLNGVCALVIPHLEKDRRRIPVLIQGISKSNYVLVGINLVTMVYGDDIGMAGMIVAVTAPVNNILSTIVFESYRGGNVKPGEFARKIITNPIVLSGIAGLVPNLLGIKIPKFILNDIIGKIGNCATPIALIMMGAGFSFEYASHYKKQIAIATVGRLIVAPLVVLPIVVLMGYRGANLLSLMLLAATPAAVNSYNTAVAMGGDGDLAGAIVAITSVGSVLTMFMWVTVLSMMGLL